MKGGVEPHSCPAKYRVSSRSLSLSSSLEMTSSHQPQAAGSSLIKNHYQAKYPAVLLSERRKPYVGGIKRCKENV
jgi:hypothetical protein